MSKSWYGIRRKRSIAVHVRLSPVLLSNNAVVPGEGQGVRKLNRMPLLSQLPCFPGSVGVLHFSCKLPVSVKVVFCVVWRAGGGGVHGSPELSHFQVPSTA